MSILFKLPAHLEKFEHVSPKPMTSSEVCDMGECWIDPKTETVFWANGFGYFESGAWVVSEHPDLPLKRFDEYQDEISTKEFVALIEDVKEMGHDSSFGLGRVLKALTSYGVKWTTVEEQLVRAEWPVTFYTSLSGFTKAIEQRARKRFEAMSVGHKMAADIKKPKGVENAMTATDFRIKWDACVDKLDRAGLEPFGLINDLLKRVCADLGCPVELNEQSIEALVTAVDNEVAVSGYVPPVEQEPATPSEQIDINSFAKDFGSDSKSAKLVEDVLARREARKKDKQDDQPQQMDLLRELEKAVEPTSESEMQSEDPAVRLWYIHELAQNAGITKEEVKQIHESLTVNDLGMTFEVLDALHEAIVELCETRKALDEVDPSPKPKGKKSSKPKKESNVTELPMPPKELMYAKTVTNRSSGEVKTFEEAMRLIKTQLEWAEYYENQAKIAKRIVAGYYFCYWSDIHEIVHAQFKRQHRGNGLFKPGTVETSVGVFKRKAKEKSPAANCTNKAEFQMYLDELTPEEAVLRGDALKMVFVPDKDKIATQVANGIKWPGWEKAPPALDEEDEDIVGDIWLEGNKTIKPKEFSENDKDDAEDEEAA